MYSRIESKILTKVSEIIDWRNRWFSHVFTFLDNQNRNSPHTWTQHCHVHTHPLHSSHQKALYDNLSTNIFSVGIWMSREHKKDWVWWYGYCKSNTSRLMSAQMHPKKPLLLGPKEGWSLGNSKQPIWRFVSPIENGDLKPASRASWKNLKTFGGGGGFCLTRCATSTHEKSWT